MARLIVPIKNPSPPKPPVLSLVSACAAVNPWTDDTDGRWTGGFAYAPENRYAGEIRDPCDYVTDDVPALPAPVLIVADLVDTGTGGTLAANTAYAYVATFVNANGQTTGSTERSITTGGGAGTHTVTITAPLPDGSSEEGITVDVYGRVHGSLGSDSSRHRPDGLRVSRVHLDLDRHRRCGSGRGGSLEQHHSGTGELRQRGGSHLLPVARSRRGRVQLMGIRGARLQRPRHPAPGERDA